MSGDASDLAGRLALAEEVEVLGVERAVLVAEMMHVSGTSLPRRVFSDELIGERAGGRNGYAGR